MANKYVSKKRFRLELLQIVEKIFKNLKDEQDYSKWIDWLYSLNNPDSVADLFINLIKIPHLKALSLQLAFSLADN